MRPRSVRTRLEAAVERGLTPLIGRDRELAVLRDHFERAITAMASVVFVSGEAGIGKSRLLLEFRRSLRDEVAWLEGHCVSYGRSIPYLPIIDIIKAPVRRQEGDDDERSSSASTRARADWDDARQGRRSLPQVPAERGSGRSRRPGDGPMARRAGIFDALRTLADPEHARPPAVHRRRGPALGRRVISKRRSAPLWT